MAQPSPAFVELNSEPLPSATAQVEPVQETAASSFAPSMACLVATASPVGSIVSSRTSPLRSTAMHDVVELQATPRRAVVPSTLVEVHPAASLIPCSVVATWTLPESSTTAQNDEDRQETSFIAPAPMLTAVQEIPEGLVE